MPTTLPSPSAGRGSVSSRQRALAVAALASLALLVGLVLASVVTDFIGLLLAVAGLFIAVLGGWTAITEQMPRRAFGVAIAAVGLVVVGVALATAVHQTDAWFARIALAIALATSATVCARLAIVASLHASDLAHTPVPFKPERPVLICNPLSGGGKVGTFDLVPRARQLGVEVLELAEGVDLEQLARDAVARGADCLGMAGGDGSQALVAAIAREHDLPFVCISAGTRNHFALDLGLDRDDPSKGLAAYTDGVIRRVDVATVGSRLFVNNVSLGVYAQIVEQDDYRDAKVATTRDSLPELLGRAAESFDLQFTDPDGREVDGSFVILVSNNPYVLGPRIDLSQRRSLTTGRLGVFAVNADSGREAAAAVVRTALGRAAADPRVHQFTAETFEVRSRSGSAAVGIDGESLTLPTPLEFRIHPLGLTLLVPPENIEENAARHFRSFGVQGLWSIARGRPPAA